MLGVKVLTYAGPDHGTIKVTFNNLEAVRK